MVALCRARFLGAAWVIGDMRAMRLGGLVAWHSFFHLALGDQRAMFARFRDHALPGAALMFTSGPEHGERIGCFEGEPLYHASLSPHEYCRLLSEHGFEILENRFEDPDCGGATVWLARRIADPCHEPAARRGT